MRIGRDILQDFHRDQGGAIMILALVALLILLMLGMTMYDAGDAAHTKIQTQAAADSAAFSQAAIKARSMNMLAYANIAKRSIWGIHSLYPSYLKSMHRWISSTINSNCQPCADSDPESNACKLCRAAKRERHRWIDATCEDRSSVDSDQYRSSCTTGDPNSWGTFRHLSGRDYSRALTWNKDHTRIVDDDLDWADPTYIRTHHFGAKSSTPPNLFEAYVARDVRALDNYQRYIFGLTPWWGWTEQLVRAVRDGATMSGSWPAPVGAFPLSLGSMVNNIIQRFRGLFGGANGVASPNFTLYADSLPVYPGHVGTMQHYLANAVGNSGVRSCLLSILQGGSCTQHIDPFLLEHLANALVFWLKSDGVAAGEYNNLNTVQGMAATVGIHFNAVFHDFINTGLPYTQNSFENILGSDKIVAEPWLVRPAKTASHWRLSTSNIVLTYKTHYGVFDKDRGRKKLGFMKQDYRDNSLKGLAARAQLYGTPSTPVVVGDDYVSQELTYNASGQWAMARAEIFFKHGGSPDLWHPSWSSRLRPLAIGDEYSEADYSLNSVYHDAVPGFALAAAMGITNLSDLFTALSDLAFMEKATLSMGPSTIQGVSK